MKKDVKTAPPKENAAQVAAAARKWVASPEGQRALAAGLERAQEMAAQFREAQRVDPKILDKPVTL